jgi:hypothetical protein
MVSLRSVVNCGFTANLSKIHKRHGYRKQRRPADEKYNLCRNGCPQGHIHCPTSIAGTAKDKAVKTDKSDAQMLAKTLAFRSYREVVLPSENIEAVKEIVRLRNSALKVCKQAKQNLLFFLLVHGFSYSDGK